MIRFSVLAVALTGYIAASSNAIASQIVYSVDFGGTTGGHNPPVTAPGHHLEIAGTVVFDTALQSVTDSHLGFFHEQDLPLPMESLPNIPLAAGAWHWQATPSELRLFLDGPALFNLGFTWVTNPGPTIEDTYGVSGVNDEFGPRVFLIYSNTNPPDPRFNHFPDDDRFGLPVAAAGFLFGTAVPEPSTLALGALGALGLLIVVRRKR